MPDRTERSQARGVTSPSTRMWDGIVVAMVAIGTATLLWRQREIVSGRGVPSTPPSHDSLDAGYELKDISVRGVSYVLVAIGAAVAISLGVVFLFVGRFETAHTASFKSLTAEQTAVTVTPAPHLQLHPQDDLAQVRVREQRLLQGYGWTDREHTQAHIPIDRAMALMVGRSLEPVP